MSAQSLSTNLFGALTALLCGRADSRSLASKLNWLRAGVLGANDGIVSIAGIVLGVSGAALTGRALIASGIAGIVAGALSMAAGEFVSVSTQRDTERAALTSIRARLASSPTQSLASLTSRIEGTGLSREVAEQVAEQLSGKDPVSAHARYEFGIDSEELTNPWHAAFASMVAFLIGALVPFLAIVLTPPTIAVAVTVVAVTIALALTGALSAALGGAPKLPATLRNIAGGLLAMGVTYGIGALVALAA